jgi:hypothetical protein
MINDEKINLIKLNMVINNLEKRLSGLKDSISNNDNQKTEQLIDEMELNLGKAIKYLSIINFEIDDYWLIIKNLKDDLNLAKKASKLAEHDKKCALNEEIILKKLLVLYLDTKNQLRNL